MTSPARKKQNKTSVNFYVTNSFLNNLYKFCEDKDIVPSHLIQRVINERILDNYFAK